MEVLTDEYWANDRIVDIFKEGYEIAFNAISKKNYIILLDFAISFIKDKFLESINYRGSFVDFGDMKDREMINAEVVDRLLDETTKSKI